MFSHNFTQTLSHNSNKAKAGTDAAQAHAKNCESFGSCLFFIRPCPCPSAQHLTPPLVRQACAAWSWRSIVAAHENNSAYMCRPRERPNGSKTEAEGRWCQPHKQRNLTPACTCLHLSIMSNLSYFCNSPANAVLCKCLNLCNAQLILPGRSWNMRSRKPDSNMCWWVLCQGIIEHLCRTASSPTRPVHECPLYRVMVLPPSVQNSASVNVCL